MQLKRAKIAVISIIATVLMVIVGCVTFSLWEQHIIEKKYHKAMALHNSMDPTERRLSLSLLSQVPVTDEVVRLIGAQLFDEELANRIYSAQRLEAIVGNRAPFPTSGLGPWTLTIARPEMTDPKGMLQLKFTPEELEKYIGAWQRWYRATYIA